MRGLLTLKRSENDKKTRNAGLTRENNKYIIETKIISAKLIVFKSIVSQKCQAICPKGISIIH